MGPYRCHRACNDFGAHPLGHASNGPRAGDESDSTWKEWGKNFLKELSFDPTDLLVAALKMRRVTRWIVTSAPVPRPLGRVEIDREVWNSPTSSSEPPIGEVDEGSKHRRGRATSHDEAPRVQERGPESGVDQHELALLSKLHGFLVSAGLFGQ